MHCVLLCVILQYKNYCVKICVGKNQKYNIYTVSLYLYILIIICTIHYIHFIIQSLLLWYISCYKFRIGSNDSNKLKVLKYFIYSHMTHTYIFYSKQMWILRAYRVMWKENTFCIQANRLSQSDIKFLYWCSD